VTKWAHDKMRSGADLNGNNLRISTGYLRISDHCRVRVRVRIRVWVRVRVRVRVRINVRVGARFRVANCCIQTAGEGDKVRINHVIKTDQWRSAPQIRPAPHFVVSRQNGIQAAIRRDTTHINKLLAVGQCSSVRPLLSPSHSCICTKMTEDIIRLFIRATRNA